MSDPRLLGNDRPDILVRLREASKVIGETHPVTAALLTDAAKEIAMLRSLGCRPADDAVSGPSDGQASEANR